jgi:hypothetical protein
MESLVSDIPAGDGKIANLFFTVYGQLLMVMVVLLRKRLKKEVKEMNAAFKEELEELEALEETEKCLEVWRELFHRM